VDILNINQIKQLQTKTNLEKQTDRTENPRVGGSTPSLATIKFNNLGLPIG
jgi:hypothetical protein